MTDLFQEGGGANIFLAVSVKLYCHIVLALDILVFILKVQGDRLYMNVKY